MKRFIILLPLIAALLCSCESAKPQAETTDTSSAAVTTAAVTTTAVTTEAATTDTSATAAPVTEQLYYATSVRMNPPSFLSDKGFLTPSFDLMDADQPYYIRMYDAHCFIGDSECFCGLWRGQSSGWPDVEIYHTADKGQTWESVLAMQYELTGIYVGADGRGVLTGLTDWDERTDAPCRMFQILVTDDNGVTWTDYFTHPLNYDDNTDLLTAYGEDCGKLLPTDAAKTVGELIAITRSVGLEIDGENVFIVYTWEKNGASHTSRVQF